MRKKVRALSAGMKHRLKSVEASGRPERTPGMYREPGVHVRGTNTGEDT
jgi:hypothetical protein